MSLVPFHELPDHARLWIFPGDRTLSPEEQERLTHRVVTGLAGWAAHGSPVSWGHEIQHQQFLMVGVDETRTGLSGCSIDHAVREIKTLEGEMGMSFLDNSRVFFREDDHVRVVSRGDFRKLAEESRVGPDTRVFNNLISTVGELRRNLWEVPLRESWHARAFPIRVS